MWVHALRDFSILHSLHDRFLETKETKLVSCSYLN